MDIRTIIPYEHPSKTNSALEMIARIVLRGGEEINLNEKKIILT